MPEQTKNPFQFWQELKRRKVIRVIPVYAAAAFVLLELVDIIAEPFGLPDWTLKLVVVLLSVGFMISVILSWIYDITPEGVQKTKPIKEVQKAEKTVTSNSWKIATYVSVLIIIGFAAFYIISNIKQSSIMSKLEKSIAVLPFENWNNEEEYAHMGDAITDEIILELQKIKEFDRVLSRSSTMQYKENRPTIPEMAEKLGVNYLIEGSIQRHGEDISIRVQVIRANNEDHIWADRFDGHWKDILSIQDKIALQVAKELKAVLSPEEIEQIEKPSTDNLEAYDLYLLGRFHWNKRTEEGLKKSIEYYKKAIEINPDYALAYAGLADAYYISADWHYLRQDSALIMARLMATQAVFLDNNIAESYATLGMIAHTLEYDIALAELYLKKSLEINPNYASGNQWYALFLTSLAKFEEAFPYMEKALELDPNSAIINYAAGWMYYYATDFDKAINQIENTKMIDPNFPSDRLAFKCYFQIGQYQEVITLFENYLKDHNKFENYTSPESNRFTSEGIKSWIEYIIDYISDGPESLKWIIPMLYIHIGDTDEALNSLEYNVTNRVPHHINIGADPAYISLHSDPRFIDLAERIGFKFDN